jgi:hypothetical protein
MINSFRELGGTREIVTDLCIMGGGIAGLTLAREFLGSNWRVLVLEGGGAELELENQALYSAECIGIPHRGITEGRYRVLGGNSTKWGGQLLPLTAGDFTELSWEWMHFGLTNGCSRFGSPNGRASGNAIWPVLLERIARVQTMSTFLLMQMLFVSNLSLLDRA